jgi:hypothetical protein
MIAPCESRGRWDTFGGSVPDFDVETFPEQRDAEEESFLQLDLWFSDDPMTLQQKVGAGSLL